MPAVKASVEKNFRRAKVRPGARRSGVAGWLTWRAGRWVAAIVVGLRILYGKRGADRTPCTTCPERELSPCSGFAPIVSRERAVQRVARSILAP